MSEDVSVLPTEIPTMPVLLPLTSVRRVLLIGFLLSLCIETVQFVAAVTVSPGGSPTSTP